MKKVIFCFITIVLILILGSTGLAQELPSLEGSSSTPPPVAADSPITTTSTFVQYSNPNYGFSFDYPANWKSYTEVEGTLKIEFDLFEGEYIIASFCVYIEDTELSLSRYAILVEEWMMDPQNMPEYHKINEEAITAGELPAIKRLYTWTRINTENNSRIPIKAIDVYLVKDKKGYILEGQVTQDLFDRILLDLNVMFDSFTLTRGPVVGSTPTITLPELPEVTATGATSTITSVSSGTTESVIKYCPYCGMSLQPDYQFCPGCGKPIPTLRSITKKEDKSGSSREGKDRGINYSLDLISTFRGGAMDQLGSSIKMISSKIGSPVVDKPRSSSSLGGYFLAIGQGVSSEIGIKKEANTLPSLTPTVPQTTPTIPETPPVTGPEGIVSSTPEAPAQGGITLTPPGQPTPAQPGPGGITLPTPGTPQEPQVIWKQYSLNQAFSHNPLITGYLEYPSTWLVNLDSFNRNVTFSEDASGLISLTLFPGLMGQFSSAQDLAQQTTYLLQQRVSDLSILNQEFKIVPTPGSGAIEVTEGRINLLGSYQGTTFRFNIETYVIYTGVYGPSSGMGYVILTQAPQNIFVEIEQKYFNRMILSYKRALGVEK